MTDKLYALSDRVCDNATEVVSRRLSRGGFFRRSAMVGAAMALAPVRFLLEPQTASAFTTTCTSCSSGSACRQANSTFCCTINGGANQCPPNSGECGYWFCSTRNLFYLDCCSIGSCTGHCALDNCNNRKTCCNPRFYGNCSYPGATGNVVCRVTTIGYPYSSCTYICGTSYGTGNCDSLPSCATNPPC